ncbi:LPS-assembly protein [Mesorhizobium albiziae]|uniref:LPS-assembly protein LptD n=2 Tax=Neomesorhizobium albiziae TaxID=335020 RepID=A0A1I4DHC3_9HYPH|nr:LPS-assembly protein LptD [Mesorhizobium albiziae]SFK91877.1 LPS-assembly protein [Mesorhizobium albiziae]
MLVARAHFCSSARLARLFGATAMACVFSYVFAPAPAPAQDVQLAAPSIPANSQMLLEADTLVYDNDANTVTAAGGVQIDYGGNKLVAKRVTYDRKSGRLIASGDVALVDSEGTKVFSQEIDITDDFADGFVNALRVETVDKTYFAAESAKRERGMLTTFNNGVYTACAPCEEEPNKAPIWRLKAKKIIWNGQAKTVRFEQSRFEMFGYPIAYFPALEVPDPTVKRKTGFLIPGIAYKSDLGVGFNIPFYIALAPTYDLTLHGRYYTKQGFLGMAEWRQRFNNGQYNLRIAGISQQDPGGFQFGTVDAGTATDPNKLRGMIGSKGDFVINPRWSFGWDIVAQSDKNFSYTYGIPGYSNFVQQSQVYLTGLHERNYFDLRAMRFQVQEEYFDESASARDDKQPWVLPTLDYSYTPDEPVFGGELNFDVNARVINRSRLDSIPSTPAVRGLEGTNSRLTAEAEWKKSIITEGGIVITPMFDVRGDAAHSNISSESVAAINNMAGTLNGIDYSHGGPAYSGVAADIRSAYNRFMATAGLELRWPVLFSSTSSSHVLEPMAQLFARPDERYAGSLGIPNEDAQSFVFDASSLFERDKFSGYDRIEGGTRANIGFRYSGSYSSGWTTNALFGQSYHLAGENSFAQPDLVNVGAYSGLETDTSDYVGLAGFSSPSGLSASISGRFDEQTFEIRRAEAKAGYSIDRFSVNAKYAFIQAQPLYGFPDDRREMTLGATAKINENWKTFGSATYDFEADTVVRDSVGFTYDDGVCFLFSLTMSETRDRFTRDTSQSIGFNISFRTLGDFGTDSSSFSSN